VRREKATAVRAQEKKIEDVELWDNELAVVRLWSRPLVALAVENFRGKQ
jgi:hypothetical protein